MPGGYPLPVAKKDKWQFRPIPNLLGGIDIDRRADLLEDHQCVTCKNVLLRKDSVLADTGYRPFSNVVAGIAQAEAKWQRNNGSIVTMLITTKTLYQYSTSASQYQLVKGTTSNTLANPAPALQAYIDVVSAAGFSVGDLIGVALNSGIQHQTTIANIVGARITLANTIPAGDSAVVSAIVVRAVVLNGNLDSQASWVPVASNDWFVFTNGVDIVKRYNGTDCVDVPNLPSTGNTVCRSVAVYNAALFLLNTTEGGVTFPQRARRSDQGDPTNWTTGTSGKDDLLDSSDAIQTGKLLGVYLIVYRERSVVRCQFVGAGGLNYQFDTMVTGDGLLATNAIADLGDVHIFAGQADVYLYNGTFELRSIGDPIFQRVYGNHGNLNTSTKQRAFMVYVVELDEVLFLYPTTSNSNPDTCLRYAIDMEVWYERVFANQWVGFGNYLATNNFSWDSLVGSWIDQTWTWDSQVVIANAFTVHFCDAVSGQVYEYDYNTTLDNGTPIQYTVETKDFLEPDANIRFDMIDVMMRGTNILIEYSTDQGKSWNPMGSGTTDATIVQSIVDIVRRFKQFVGRSVRFRFTGSSSDFRLDWFAMTYKLESIF